MNDDRLARVVRDALAQRRPAPSRDFIARLDAATQRPTRPPFVAPAMLALAVVALLLLVLATLPNQREERRAVTPELPAQADRRVPPDPTAHDGKFADCAPCHGERKFVDLRALHDVGAFSLSGAHDKLPCARCHRSGEKLRGLGNTCITCHRNDDVHKGTQSPRCGECHTLRAWKPAQYAAPLKLKL